MGSGFCSALADPRKIRSHRKSQDLRVQLHMGTGTPLGSNLFSFVHETRSLSFPSACESENVLEENLGPAGIQ